MHKSLIEEALVQMLQNMRSISESLTQINKHLYVLQSRGVNIHLPEPMVESKPVHKLPSQKILLRMGSKTVWKSANFKAKTPT